jgi:glutathione synthase/RimK-type ligase-like ATP-grasp enzyme
MIKILPYKLGSKSAKDLARSLGVKRIIPGGGYRPKNNVIVVNWGNSHAHFNSGSMLNKPEAVKVACNKLSALTKMKAAGVSVPDFTTRAEDVRRWMDDGYRAMARHKLSGHSGQGIQVIRPGEQVPSAPLYTKYMKKDEEYRVHIFRGKVIDLAAKRKRSGMEVTNMLIRTHNNGWIYCREGVLCPTFVRDMCIKAVTALGLDFGAVDVVVRGDKCWVLEVNTAPGICNTTLNAYTRAIQEHASEDWV